SQAAQNTRTARLIPDRVTHVRIATPFAPAVPGRPGSAPRWRGPERPGSGPPPGHLALHRSTSRADAATTSPTSAAREGLLGRPPERGGRPEILGVRGRDPVEHPPPEPRLARQLGVDGSGGRQETAWAHPGRRV